MALFNYIINNDILLLWLQAHLAYIHTNKLVLQ